MNEMILVPEVMNALSAEGWIGTQEDRTDLINVYGLSETEADVVCEQLHNMFYERSKCILSSVYGRMVTSEMR